jgi:hypothetical protein
LVDEDAESVEADLEVCREEGDEEEEDDGDVDRRSAGQGAHRPSCVQEREHRDIDDEEVGSRMYES